MLAYMNDYKPPNCLRHRDDHCDDGPLKESHSSKPSRKREDGVNAKPANNRECSHVREKRSSPAMDIKILTPRMFTSFSHYTTTETSIKAALKGQT
jgi:hypothetical protein